MALDFIFDADLMRFSAVRKLLSIIGLEYHRRTYHREYLQERTCNAGGPLELKGDTEQELNPVINVFEEVFEVFIQEGLKVNNIDLTSCPKAKGDDRLDPRCRLFLTSQMMHIGQVSLCSLVMLWPILEYD